MFHTNKMPKIIVFRVVIEGTAPTEGPPTACHGKRPSCHEHPARPAQEPRTPKRQHRSLPTCESHFRAHICARLLCKASHEPPSAPSRLPERLPVLPMSPEHPSASIAASPTCESHFRAHICARLLCQGLP